MNHTPLPMVSPDVYLTQTMLTGITGVCLGFCFSLYAFYKPLGQSFHK